MMRRTTILIAGLGLLAACGGSGSEGMSEEARSEAARAYMNEVMQVRSEVIWNSAGWIITAEGEQDLAPTTDEGWAAVAAGAVALKEAGEELKTIAFARDAESWVAFSEGVIVAGERARLGAEAHNADEMFESGAQLYRVCVACHQFYRVGEFAPEE
jgi:hypothetical protein